MNEDDLCVGINDVASDIVPKENFFQKNKKLVFIFIICLVVLLIVFITAIISVNSNKNKKEEDGINKNKIIGEIICTFNVVNKEDAKKISSNVYSKTSEMKIFVDEKEIKYSKEHVFNSTGLHEVKFRLLEDSNMDNMFKEIYNLISVNKTSDSNDKIISMESTFDNCKTLEKFYKKGFDTKNIKSINYFYKHN